MSPGRPYCCTAQLPSAHNPLKVALALPFSHVPVTRSSPVIYLAVSAGEPVDACAPAGPDTPATVLATLAANRILTELARVPTPAGALAGGAGSSVEAGSVAVPGVSGLSAARGGQPTVLAHAQVRLHALAFSSAVVFAYWSQAEPGVPLDPPAGAALASAACPAHVRTSW